MTGPVFQGRVLNAGTAAGPALVLSEPLSFWGGFDPASGRIVDRHHPEAGALLTGQILVLPESRGSAGTPAGVAEAIRRGTAPRAILLGKADANIAAGALVAAELYGTHLPIVVMAPDDFARLRTGDRVTVAEDGRVTLRRSSATKEESAR